MNFEQNLQIIVVCQCLFADLDNYTLIERVPLFRKQSLNYQRQRTIISDTQSQMVQGKCVCACMCVCVCEHVCEREREADKVNMVNGKLLTFMASG